MFELLDRATQMELCRGGRQPQGVPEGGHVQLLNVWCATHLAAGLPLARPAICLSRMSCITGGCIIGKIVAPRQQFAFQETVHKGSVCWDAQVDCVSMPGSRTRHGRRSRCCGG